MKLANTKSSIKEQAVNEIKEELLEEARKGIKKLCKDIIDAKSILKGLERELEDMEDRVNRDIQDAD